MGTQWWLEDAVSNQEAGQCQRICIKIGELRAEVNRLMSVLLLRRQQHRRATAAATLEDWEEGSDGGVGLMLDLIRRCQAVDQEAVGWASALPDCWRPRTVAWEDHAPPGGDYARAEAFPGRVDLYTDLYIASVWNMARTSRLILHSLIVRCTAWVCSPVDYRTTPEYATAARTCVDIIADIIAAAPYHLGWHLKRRYLFRQQNQGQGQNQQWRQGVTTTPFTETTTTGGIGGFARVDEQQQQQQQQQQEEENSGASALAGDFLIWPLVCVSTQDYTTDAQRAWIQGRLRHIGNELGIKYAHVLNGVRFPSPPTSFPFPPIFP